MNKDFIYTAYLEMDYEPDTLCTRSYNLDECRDKALEIYYAYKFGGANIYDGVLITKLSLETLDESVVEMHSLFGFRCLLTSTYIYYLCSFPGMCLLSN